MDKILYKKTQDKILELVPIVRELDLDLFIKNIDIALAAGPIVDPTTYRHAQKNIQIIKNLAIGLREFKKSIPDLSTVLEGHILAHQHPTASAQDN